MGFWLLSEDYKEAIEEIVHSRGDVASFCKATGVSRSTYYKVIGRKEGCEKATIAEVITAAGLDKNDAKFYENTRKRKNVTGPTETPKSEICTVLFTDIKDSCDHWTKKGYAFARVWEWHDQFLRDCTEAHKGQVIKGTGDGFYLRFEEANDAILCAVEAQKKLGAGGLSAEHEGNTELCVRMGIHTGLFLLKVKNGVPDLIGPDANLAARVMGAAYEGQILITDAVCGAIQAEQLPLRLAYLGKPTLRGVDPVGLWEVQCEGVRSNFSPRIRVAADQLYWRVPYEQNDYFTGRDAIFEELCAKLPRTGATAPSQALRGLGGVGKTQTAVEYAYRCCKREPGYPEYSAILWANAATRESLIADYRDIAETLGLPGKDAQDINAAVAQVIAWLADPTHPGYLLVLDNADTPDLLPEFLPNSRKGQFRQGHLLVTTRAANLRGIAIPASIELKEMLPEEAVKFLLKSTGRESVDAEERKAAAQLAHELGYLPLALEQATAYISNHAKSFASYLRLYRQLSLKLLEQYAPEKGEYPLTVAKTWEINFRQIEAHYPSSAELLRFCAFLDPDAIPMELALAGTAIGNTALAQRMSQIRSDAEAELLYDELLEPLNRYSLARINANTTFSLHKMVQAVLRDRMQEDDKRQSYITRVVQVLNAVFPDVTDFRNWPACERLAVHTLALKRWIEWAELETEDVARLYNQTAYYLYDRAQYSEAEPLYKEALAIRRKALPEGHPDIALSLNNLAGLYRSQGRYDEAEPLYQEAFAIFIAALGPQHPNTQTVFQNYLSFLLEAGMEDKAEALWPGIVEEIRLMGNAEE
ncbi:MAG TPA: tetratricopeptide repeat protein [Chthonomonadaceae bacterium]|nr:tetratricopeptide repeat protein [Chthonomonadaceae bacterium]